MATRSRCCSVTGITSKYAVFDACCNEGVKINPSLNDFFGDCELAAGTFAAIHPKRQSQALRTTGPREAGWAGVQSEACAHGLGLSNPVVRIGEETQNEESPPRRAFFILASSRGLFAVFQRSRRGWISL
jgi:hypothetical protein